MVNGINGAGGYVYGVHEEEPVLDGPAELDINLLASVFMD